MILSKEMDGRGVGRSRLETFLKLLSPFAPHLCEELWHNLGNKTSIHLEGWPTYDESLVEEEMKTIAVQVAGRTRAIIHSADVKEEHIKTLALAQPNVKRALAGKTPSRTIYVAGKVINFIV